MLMEDLRSALRDAHADGVDVGAIVLHPLTAVHVADPALGLAPLSALEMDAVDGVPVRADETVARGEVVLAPRRRGA